MRTRTYTASERVEEGGDSVIGESVEERGDSGIGTKRTCTKEGVAANVKRMKLAATIVKPRVNPQDEGGSCGVGADGGADATARKNPKGGAYSKAKSGDLWMHTIN